MAIATGFDPVGTLFLVGSSPTNTDYWDVGKWSKPTVFGTVIRRFESYHPRFIYGGCVGIGRQAWL